MNVTAQMVKELREKTGAGMMDCKKVLVAAEGDFDKATSLLREKGIAKATSKQGRTTAEGVIATYVHTGDKLGVMVEVNCETDFVARTDKFKIFARDIAMHIAAASPLCVKREEVDPKLIQEEREIYRRQALNEGKPEKIADRIVEGRLDKYYSDVVLLEQPYVKDSDNTVANFIKDMIAGLGENIIISRFTRFRLGE